jgi:hypothetical protein
MEYSWLFPFLGTTQTPLSRFFLGIKVLDGLAIAPAILYTLIGIVLACCFPERVVALARKARHTHLSHKIKGNHKGSSIVLIVVAEDRHMEAISDRVAELIHEISSYHEVSPTGGEDANCLPKRSSSFPTSKRRRPPRGFYKDLLQGKVMDGYQSE